MRQFVPPLRIRSPKAPSPSVFLAGSIDMGSARDWQKQFVSEFEPFPGSILNPRRDDWDSSWKQEDSDPKFREQVEWELDFMASADYVFMFISSESKAPITLLEFGYLAHSFPSKLFVCVEEGFYRRGNIEVICRRQGIPLFKDFKTAVETFKIKIASQL